MSSVAFLCLGAMGRPMAGHLARAGHAVVAYNRTRGKAEAWAAEYGGRVASTPRDAVSGAEFVFACTGNDADLREITLGAQGAFAALAPGAVFVDHTTASPALARELAAEAEKRGAHFVDAPVSGGEEGAKRGQLSIMAGGDAAAFERAREVFACYAKAALLIGPSGAGQLTKAVNQLCIAGVLAGLSEGLAFAEKSGLDLTRVIEAVSKGAAQSWQLDNRARTMAERRYDFGFAVDWMRKDLGIAFAEAARIGASVDAARAVDALYAQLQRGGGGRRDTSSLIEAVR
ncbi:MAG: NAD(P)-dependent oxidoreductase [Deltaproteobacteria bacterium]|nr:NAD(P)-dependent oxidoreductase [Deltaproteobacteria bacterium]